MRNTKVRRVRDEAIDVRWLGIRNPTTMLALDKRRIAKRRRQRIRRLVAAHCRVMGWLATWK